MNNTDDDALDCLDDLVKEYAAKIVELRAKLAFATEALEHYADDTLYFPRGIVLECNKRKIRLAPIYSDFGETAIDTLARIKEATE